jgi:alkyldihydroxyacetonephosphate synthase
VGAVLAACAAEDLSVVPFGGGTSVVGGVEPLRAGHRGAVTLDLTRMRGIETDPTSLTAVLGPGHTGPQAEAALAERGYTLGHFPQSFEFATVGGFVATRSAGQASTGYGRIDELVLGVRMSCPAGELVARPFPGTAAGPRLRELTVGSEGVLGVITEATLRIRPAPRARVYEAWRFDSFGEGCEAYRAMEQAEAAADICRLSDEAETALSLARAGSGEQVEPGGSLAIVGFEGEPEEVERRRGRAAGFLKGAGARNLGEGPGAAWERGRYRAPYLRDDLLDRGVMVETLETSTWWSNLDTLYTAVGDALRSALGQALVLCHVSHLYPSGASLYFTFITAQDAEDPLGQWRRAKTAACDAIASNGGTITHHHAVGRDHAPWMRSEVGDTGLEVLQAAKERLDPAGIMNPGKLLP